MSVSTVIGVSSPYPQVLTVCSISSDLGSHPGRGRLLPHNYLQKGVSDDPKTGNPLYPTAAEAGGISGRSAAAYPNRHGSARHHKRRYCSRVSLSALRTIGIEASASRTRRSRGGIPGTNSAIDAARTPCRVAAHMWSRKLIQRRRPGG